MRTFSGSDQFKELQNVVLESYSKLFPVENNGYRLELGKLWLDDAAVDRHDYTDQKKVKLAGGTWGAPVLASLVLKDQAGKVVDRMDKVRLATIPRITPRGSYIVKGNEYQVANQMIRKPSAYVVRTQKGDTFKGQIALTGDRQQNFEVHFDPATNKYKTKLGQAYIPLYPLLKSLGATDKEMIGAWGEKIFNANKQEKPSDYFKYADKLARAPKTDNQQTAIDAIQAFAKTTKVDPSITNLTLGHPHVSLSRGLLLDTSKKILGVYQGKIEPDDPENLLFKEIRSVEDMLQDRLGSKKEQDGLRRMLSRHLGRRQTIKQLIDFRKLTAPVESFFTTDNRTSTPEQWNPVHMVAEQNKLTIHGVGGITSAHAVSPSIREVHPSHIGFVDPIDTPESGVGETLHLASSVMKDGRNIRTFVKNVKSGKMELLTPQELYFKTVAFPDEAVDGKFKVPGSVRVQSQGKIDIVPSHKVDYIFPHPTGLFSRSTNLVPFLKNDQGNRAMMAAKMLGQALPLVEREAPLVQTATPTGQTFHEVFGKEFSIRAEHDGIVTAVAADHISIGKTKIPLYNNFPLNQKTGLHHTPLVKVGDKVKSGQLIADSNFTKDGRLAIGKNLTVAYLPYPGYTFEDGIVITESAAKKLAAEQTYRHNFKLEQNRTKTGLREFLSYYPNTMTRDMLPAYDPDGVIKKGSVVKPGQILIAGMSYAAHSPENMSLRRTNKALSIPWSNSSVKYTGEFNGTVTDVVKRGDQIEVFVKAVEPAKESDKLSGTHGNKGVITKVIPDSEAPRTKDGKIPDVFLNPHGIVGRINLGQLYESAAGKIALKTGKPYIVHNFNTAPANETVLAELKKHGLSDTEEMVTPDGKSLGQVSIGNPYILRLAKTGKTGFSARMPGQGYDVNRQPVKGGEEGAKALDQLTFFSMLSHGAKKNLLDSHVKSERNDEFWHAIETGKIPPAPQQPFAFDKFIGMLKGAGVDVEKRGASEYVLAPLTDKQTLKLSHGKIDDFNFLYGKNFKEIKGGLFDPAITGGIAQGKNYAHIELPEKMPNPVFERAIMSLTNLKEPVYRNIIAGRAHIDKDGKVISERAAGSKTGGDAIAALLKKIDLESDTAKFKKQLRLAKTDADIEKLNRKIRYLSALKELNLRPEEAYIRQSVPVVPPIYRPVQELPSGKMVVAPPNYLYQNLGILAKAYEHPVMKFLDDSEKSQLRDETYKSSRALAGLEPVMTRGKDQPIEGFISQITNKSPKAGFFLNKLITKRQDLVGRGVITNGPELHMDEIGIPEKMAKSIFRPFTVREFTAAGYQPLAAKKEIEENTPLARKMLESAMSKRTVMMNRAPSLHKFSIMAFKPRLTEGLSIKVPPLVFKGFNADIDGDNQLNSLAFLINDDLDSKLRLTKGDAWVTMRYMSARMKEQVPFLKDKKVIICDLSETPRGAFHGTVAGRNGPINFYHAPKGLSVISWDSDAAQLVSAPVSFWTEHPDREVEIVTLQSGRQIVTDDDPRAVYGVRAGRLIAERFTPSQATVLKALVPRAIDTFSGTEDHVSEIHTFEYNTSSSGKAKTLKETISLDGLAGYYFGAICGDGWASTQQNGCVNSYGVCLAALTNEIKDKVTEFVRRVLGLEDGYEPYSTQRKAGGYGDISIKHSYYSQSLCNMTLELLGHLAENKHLPPFFLATPREFRKGLLAGLIDTDGSIQLGIAKSKNKPQLMISLATNSIRLAQEATLLARSLGIRSGIVSSRTPLGKPCWAINFSNMGFKKVMEPALFQHPTKRKHLEDGVVDMSPASARHDLVPASTNLFKLLRKKMGAPRNAALDVKCLYTMISKSIGVGYISRDSAVKIIKHFSMEYVQSLPDGKQWFSIVDNTAVTWDPVVSYEKTGIKETGYDLTVPGYETFMAVDGTILSNTMSVHVPVSEEALKESIKMFPSNNLWKPGTGELMTVPTQESAIGLYFLSQTPAGREQINKILPKQNHITRQLSKSDAHELYNKLAKEHPQQFPNLVHSLKFLGDKHAYETGFTASIADVTVDTTARDAVFKKADQAAETLKKAVPSSVERDNKIAGIYEKAAQEAYSHTKKQLAKQDSSFYHMVESGARGKNEQLMQMVSAPGIVTGAKDRKVPVPIKKSYAEGITTSDYFMASYGVRKGMMDRSLQTEKPGALNKDIMASVSDHLVTEPDCGTKRGIILKTTSPDVYSRFLAKDQHGFARNTKVTPQVLSDLKKKHVGEIEVRSPLRCLSAKGMCSHCFGEDENGHLPQIGDNVGAKAGQTITEPLVQFVMKTFHTGGVSTGAPTAKGFDRVNQLIKMPDYVAGEEVLADGPGRVTKITKTPAGGHDIHLDGESRIARPGLTPVVKVGDTVAKGDKLTDGVIRPQTLLKHKGMREAQNYIVDELKQTYAQQGIPMQRKVFETVVRAATNTTRVMEAPKHSDFLAGDVIPFTTAQHYNETRRVNVPIKSSAGFFLRDAIGKLPQFHEIQDKDMTYLHDMGYNHLDVLKDPLIHAPLIKGITRVPLLRKDWMSQLGYQHLEKAITEGASQAWKSNVAGQHPVPAFAYGASFGKKKEHY